MHSTHHHRSDARRRFASPRRALLAIAAIVLPYAARAQVPSSHPYPELRVDALFGRPETVQGSAGVVVPFGYYTRLTLSAGGGAARLVDRTIATARADAIARFLLDPFRESRWGLSAGGGVSMRWDDNVGWRPYLAMVLDLEGPRAAGVSPAFQLGLGGGARVGVAVRWGGPAAR